MEGETMPTLRKNLTSQQALDELERLYDGAVDALREAIKAFTENGTLPDATARAQGLFVYPELRITWHGDGPQQNRTRAWGRFTHTGKALLMAISHASRACDTNGVSGTTPCA